MNSNKLLYKQIKKYLPDSIKDDPRLNDFLKVVNDSYNTFEDEKKMAKRVLEISEIEYSDINSKLSTEIDTKAKLLNKLKHSLNLLDTENKLIEDTDVLKISDYINKQIFDIKRLEKLFVSLINNLKNGLFKTNKLGKVLYINQAFFDLFEIESDAKQNIGLHFSDVIAKANISAENKDKFISYTNEHILSVGIVRDKMLELSNLGIFETDFIPIFTDDIYVGHICQFKNITNRRKSEIELIKQKKFTDEVLNNIPADIAVFTPDHKYLFVNHHGIKDVTLRNWIIGKDDFDYCELKHVDDTLAKTRRDKFNTSVTTKSISDWEDQHVNASGEKVTIFRRFFPFFEDDVLQFVIGYGVDVSKIKNSEAKLGKTLLELEANNAELKRFAYVASHDLQEPLRMVSSFLSLLEIRLKDKLDADSKRFIDFAVDGAERMKNLINDLLNYSRMGVDKEAFTSINVSELLEYVLSVLDVSIKEKNATIMVNTMLIIHGGKTMLHQLFLNLLTNALKYCKEIPKVEIGFTEEIDKWVFYVKDNGIGIGAKYSDQIFAAFKRLHTRTEYSGTGIGLSVCKKIVEAHGGKIWVESIPTQGSTFYFTISKNIHA
jgi:signal transduction histidine kinase